MMPTTTLYHWNVPGSPVNVLVELPVVDRFRAAATSSATEVGGLLIGHFEGPYTIVTDFDAIDSEHRRGSAFTLSQKDEPRLRQQLEYHRKRGSTVVGFFRSHLRPGMFLDEGDYQIISSYFHGANQVVLLIRPADDRKATGGFFFWEDGEMNRKQTYLQFPMSTRELETGDYPLLEPIYHKPVSGDAAATETYGVVHHAPVPETVAGVAANGAVNGALNAQAVQPSDPRATRVRNGNAPTDASAARPNANAATGSQAAKLSWPLIGAIAAVAAFGGYLIGTSGSHKDGFGARPGDITLDSTPNPPDPLPAAPSAAKPSPLAANTPPENPLSSGTAATATGDRPIATEKPVTPPKPRVVTPVPETPQAVTPEPVQPTPAVPAPVTTPVPAPGWQHFGAQPGDAPAPAPAPVATAAPNAESSVYLETVEDGGMRRALGKIAFGHYKGGADFTPPQVVRSFAPKVPSDLARQLTANTPVDLRLKVDKNGKVTSVEILSRDADSQFVKLAGDAAYGWQFEPAKMKDKVVTSDVIAHFRFKPAL